METVSTPIAPIASVVQEVFSPELSIESISFTGVDPHWAQRSISVMETTLHAALNAAMIETPRFTPHTLEQPLALELRTVDFSSPERFGKALARAIIRQISL